MLRCRHLCYMINNHVVESMQNYYFQQYCVFSRRCVHIMYAVYAIYVFVLLYVPTSRFICNLRTIMFQACPEGVNLDTFWINFASVLHQSCTNLRPWHGDFALVPVGEKFLQECTVRVGIPTFCIFFSSDFS